MYNDFAQVYDRLQDADYEAFSAKLAEIGGGRITCDQTGERFSY